MHRAASCVGAPWSWWRIGPVDSAWAWAIVLVCLGLCMHRVAPWLDKLALQEPLANLRTHTWPQVEALALTGRLDSLPAGPAQQPGRFRYMFDQGQAVAGGVKRDGQTAFQLGMRVAVQDGALAWHVLPVCGLRQDPAGWRSPAQPLAVGLQAAELPWTCRPHGHRH
jgi:hypothetical protein